MPVTDFADDFRRDLAGVGVVASNVWELVNTRQDYHLAIPVLLDWASNIVERVPEADRSRFCEGLVRSLTTTKAQPVAARTMIDLFTSQIFENDRLLLWTVGNAVSVVSDDSYFQELVGIAQDRKYGMSRQMIVLGLGRSKRPEVIPILIDLLRDDDVVLQAYDAIKKINPPEIRTIAAGLLQNEKAQVRKEAANTIRKIGD